MFRLLSMIKLQWLNFIQFAMKQSKAKATNRPNTKPNTKQIFTHQTCLGELLITTPPWSIYKMEEINACGHVVTTSCSTCRHNPKLANVGSRGKLVETKEFSTIHFQSIETPVKLTWNNVSSSYLDIFGCLCFNLCCGGQGGSNGPISHHITWGERQKKQCHEIWP